MQVFWLSKLPVEVTSYFWWCVGELRSSSTLLVFLRNEIENTSNLLFNNKNSILAIYNLTSSQNPYSSKAKSQYTIWQILEKTNKTTNRLYYILTMYSCTTSSDSKYGNMTRIFIRNSTNYFSSRRLVNTTHCSITIKTA